MWRGRPYLTPVTVLPWRSMKAALLDSTFDAAPFYERKFHMRCLPFPSESKDPTLPMVLDALPSFSPAAVLYLCTDFAKSYSPRTLMEALGLEANSTPTSAAAAAAVEVTEPGVTEPSKHKDEVLRELMLTQMKLQDTMMANYKRAASVPCMQPLPVPLPVSLTVLVSGCQIVQLSRKDVERRSSEYLKVKPDQSTVLNQYSAYLVRYDRPSWWS